MFIQSATEWASRVCLGAVMEQVNILPLMELEFFGIIYIM